MQELIDLLQTHVADNPPVLFLDEVFIKEAFANGGMLSMDKAMIATGFHVQIDEESKKAIRIFIGLESLKDRIEDSKRFEVPDPLPSLLGDFLEIRDAALEVPANGGN